MKVLIVGAGQVGVVYGHHLKRGDAQVSFLVKEKYAAQARKGFSLYPLRLGHRSAPPAERLEGVGVLTSLSEVKAAGASAPWDWVLLAIPSTALREEGFLDGLLQAVGPITPIVALQMGLGDEEWLESRMGKTRLHTGMINLVSFAVPLGWLKTPTPGTAYFLPPFSSMPFSGQNKTALKALTAAATAGGLRSEIAGNTSTSSRLPDALIFALVGALELVGWSFEKLRKSDALQLTLDAAREQELVRQARGEGPPPQALAWVTSRFILLALKIGARIMPMPIEDVICTHFKKVILIFQVGRERFLAEGAKHGIPMPRLAELQRRLSATQPGRSALGATQTLS